MAHDPSSFRSILVPLDGSSFAEQAVPLASRIAQRAGGKLRLALVHRLPSAPIDPVAAKLFTSIELATRKSERCIPPRHPGPPPGRRHAAGLGGDADGNGRPRARPVRAGAGHRSRGHVHARTGRYPARVAGQRSRSSDPQSQGTGAAGAAARGRAGAGSTGRPGPDPGAAGWLPARRGGAHTAAALARAWDAELALLQVVRPIILSADPTLPLPSAFDEDLTTMWRTHAQDYIDGIVEELHEQGIRATGVAAIGWYAADSILEAARPERVAAVVIATHGRGGLRRLALGSVADKVVRGADVPVLVYRPAGRGAATKRSAPRAGSRGQRAAQGGKR